MRVAALDFRKLGSWVDRWLKRLAAEVELVTPRGQTGLTFQFRGPVKNDIDRNRTIVQILSDEKAFPVVRSSVTPSFGRRIRNGEEHGGAACFESQT